MPQSLRSRFNGSAKEVVDYCRVWGRHKAMDKYEVRDYIAFSRFIEEATGNPNFGLSPALGTGNTGNLAEDLLDAFTHKLLKMEARQRQLEDKLAQAERELEYYKGQSACRIEPKAQQILKYCQEGA